MINYSIGHHEEHFCETIFEFGLVVQKEMPFKDILCSRTLAALLSSIAEPFVQFWKRAL